MDQLRHVIEIWTGYGQSLAGSIGALAFVMAFIWKMVAVEPRSVLEAKGWIGRIAFRTIGVEMAGILARGRVSPAPPFVGPGHDPRLKLALSALDRSLNAS